jgi:hypothetical protein
MVSWAKRPVKKILPDLSLFHFFTFADPARAALRRAISAAM